jgi:transcriptional antiterminator RfaH
MSYWTVAQTETTRESVAVHFLGQQGFETYLPKIRSHRRIVPLFPSYVFIRIETHWYAIGKTIGVIGVLTSGDQPARLKDEIIKQIKNKERNGVVKLPEPRRLIPGDKIRIVKGSFAGQFAIYQGMSAHERTKVLLDLLGRKVVVEINQSDLQALA